MPRFPRRTGGGYYLLIDIRGEQAQIRGRLVGNAAEYRYANQFKSYQDQDPLWFKTVTDYTPHTRLINPSFDQGLQGWTKTYRYQTDTDPGFIAHTTTASTVETGQSAYLFCQEKGKAWARDEVMELYQMVQIPVGTDPVFTAHYFSISLKRGGGYLRLCAYQKQKLALMLLFDWNDGHKQETKYLIEHCFYMAEGHTANFPQLEAWKEQKKMLSWELPATLGQWHQTQVNLAEVYDRAVQRKRAFAELEVDRLLIAVGVWCLNRRSSHSSGYFDALSLDARSRTPRR